MAGLIRKIRPFGNAVARGACLCIVCVSLSLAGGGCVVYEPVPVSRTYTIDNYDRIWDSALKAIQDEGAKVTGADKERGIITGAKDSADITVNILRQADRTTRVEFNVESSQLPRPEISKLIDNLYRHYERHMGR